MPPRFEASYTLTWVTPDCVHVRLPLLWSPFPTWQRLPRYRIYITLHLISAFAHTIVIFSCQVSVRMLSDVIFANLSWTVFLCVAFFAGSAVIEIWRGKNVEALKIWRIIKVRFNSWRYLLDGPGMIQRAYDKARLPHTSITG